MKLLLIFVGMLLFVSSNALFACGFNCRDAVDAESSYYLTPEKHLGGEVLDNCAAGYHVASVWEMTGYNMMTYNREIGFPYIGDTGQFVFDIEYGPPTGLHGWVRSNFIADEYNSCSKWTDSTNAADGVTIVFWISDTIGPTEVVEPVVKLEQKLCDYPTRIWCVSNPR